MKNVNSHRDSSIGRLLAEALEANAAPVPEGSCLEAGTLAAWADGTLASHERARAEAHAANCARCQTLLAVMIKSTPPAVAEKSAWRLPALGWLIPLTAAAAAALVWAIVPGRATLPSSGRPVSVADQTATATALAATPSAPVQPDAQGQRPVPSSRAPTDIKAPPSAPRGQPDASPVEERADARDSLQSVDKLDIGMRATTAAKALSKTAIVGGPEAVEPPRVAAGPSASPVPAAIGSPHVLARRAGAAGTVIVSPSPVSRWRIVPGRTVERSTDGGSTWTAQETGTTVTLAGGASPSPSVCWLVGLTGTVLLSTDGRIWQRIAFPEAADLISVRAVDAKIATVTASDGRIFSTTDGGLTWMRSGNVQ